MNSVKLALSFIFGAAAGAGVTYFITKKYFQKIADEEIASVKARFTVEKKNVIVKEDPKNIEEVVSVDAHSSIENEPSSKSYTPYSEYYETKEEVNDLSDDGIVEEIHPVTPMEFNDEYANNEAYEKVDLFLFSDGVVADSSFEPLKDADSYLGNNWKSHIGEYDEDVVYIRNHKINTDFCVVTDERDWAGIKKATPYLRTINDVRPDREIYEE